MGISVCGIFWWLFWWLRGVHLGVVGFEVEAA